METTAMPGKRGRKAGTKIGPRKVYFVCVANDGGEIVEEEICFAEEDPQTGKVLGASSENAAKMFEEKYSIEPSIIRGPYHIVKSLQQEDSAPKDSEFVSMPLDQIKYNGKRYRGEFRGWSIIGQGLEGRDDVVCVIIGDPISAYKKRKPSIGNQAVLISAIDNFRPFEQQDI